MGNQLLSLHQPVCEEHLQECSYLILVVQPILLFLMTHSALCSIPVMEMSHSLNHLLAPASHCPHDRPHVIPQPGTPEILRVDRQLLRNSSLNESSRYARNVHRYTRRDRILSCRLERVVAETSLFYPPKQAYSHRAFFRWHRT